MNAGLESSDETVGKAIRRTQKSIVEEYEKQERKENMKIEDCKTVPEFFGVNIHDRIWVEGKRFKVYRYALGGEQSAPNEASRALVGCLTGQLKWSTKKPVTAESGGCEWCSDLSRYRGFGYACFFDQIAVDETYELSVEVKYCPNCGRKLLTEPTTEEEIKILREIAAWHNNWDTLSLTNSGTIYRTSSANNDYAVVPFGNKGNGSKAYEVLAPILKKYGEINLDEYREKINE